MLDPVQQLQEESNLLLGHGAAQAVIPRGIIRVGVDVPRLLQLPLQQRAVVGDAEVARMQQAVFQKLPAELRVSAVSQHADGIADEEVRAAAPVRRGKADDADRLAHPAALPGQIGNGIDHDQLRDDIAVRHQIIAENHVVGILRRLVHIPGGLQHTHESGIIEVAGDLLPVDALTQIAADRQVQEVVPGQVVHDHAPLGGLGVDAIVVVKAPAPGFSEAAAKADAGLQGEGVRHHVETAAVVQDRVRQHQVLRSQVRVCLQILPEVPQQPLADIVEGGQGAVQHQHVRPLTALDLGVQPGQRLLGRKTPSLGQIHQLHIAVRALCVEGGDALADACVVLDRVAAEVQHGLAGQHRQGQHGFGLDVRRLRRHQQQGIAPHAGEQEAPVAQGLRLDGAVDAHKALVPDRQGPGLPRPLHAVQPLRQEQQEGALPVPAG